MKRQEMFFSFNFLNLFYLLLLLDPIWTQ